MTGCANSANVCPVQWMYLNDAEIACLTPENKQAVYLNNELFLKQ
jgi:hypothetical protein